jgi:hypothetical protein
VVKVYLDKVLLEEIIQLVILEVRAAVVREQKDLIVFLVLLIRPEALE